MVILVLQPKLMKVALFLSIEMALAFALSTRVAEYLVIAAAISAAVPAGWMIRALGRSYVKHRGTRVVTCPETKDFAAVKLDALRAAGSGLLGPTHLRLESCTRWPERQDCPQTCIKQIEQAPAGCRLQAILSCWYQARKCTLCRRPFGAIRWFDHKPVLLSPRGRILEWEAVPPEEIPRVLASHWPVCWDCKIVEPFHSEHPDLLGERPRK